MNAPVFQFVHSPVPPDRPPAEPEPRSALANVQALRALAAFMVVFVHLKALASMAGLQPTLFEAGNAGVDIFFVISGFIMVFTTGRKPVGPLAFLGSRLKRIAPLYWLATLAVFALAEVAPRVLQGTHAGPGALLASLAFIPFARPDGQVRPLVFVGWTLDYEMAFYVLFAVGLLARRRALGIGLVVGALVAAVALVAALRPPGVIASFYGRPIILEFGLGMLLGAAWPRLKAGPRTVRAAALAAPLAVAAMLAAPLLWPSQDRAVAFGLPALALVWSALAFERAGLALRWPWAQSLGNASYAVYLSHAFIAQGVILAGRAAGLSGPWSALGLGAAALIGVAAAGLALHYGVERPIAAALQKVGRKGGRNAVRLPVETAPAKVI